MSVTKYSIAELLDNHVNLDIECVDRVYLNGYIPAMQTSGGLVNFIKNRGFPIPSPAILKRNGDDFRNAVKHFAFENDIPIIHFERNQRKDDVAKKYRKKFDKPSGVVFIGVAQERAYAFRAKKTEKDGYINFDYSRGSVYVNHYYFYLHDEEFGPGFIKICSYAPYTIKICLNGHEWAKQQLNNEGIEFEALDNGFLSCEQPEYLQRLCDSLDSNDFIKFMDRWLERIPFPVSRADRSDGYTYSLSIRQLEMSRTQVFSRPLYGRQFFEAVIRENLDLGRPDRAQLIFGIEVRKNTPSRFSTRVITRGVSPSIKIEYKKSHLKQYFKEGRALRTEMTFNDPKDFYVNKGISNFTHLRAIGRNANRRLLDVQRASQECVIPEASVERVVSSSINKDGRRAPGLRFGDRRVRALFSALTSFAHLPNGFTNRSLRELVAGHLGPEGEYTSRKMTYDFRRLRLNGIIYRLPHKNRYVLTPYGLRVVTFFTFLYQRLFRRAYAAVEAPEAVPTAIGRVFTRLTKVFENLVGVARVGA